VITFLSDYGPGDEYVGVVEGVIATIAPQVRVLHLGHGVPAQDVRTGARRLARALPFVPAGVHLAVVDPGVGGARRAVAVRCGARWLVGPDNGLLVPAAESFGIDEVVEVSASPWRLEPVSATFHGRDVFGPVAAHLALGELPDGPRMNGVELVRLPALPVDKVNVVEVDGFGNLITDAALPSSAVRIAGHEVAVGRTFGDVPPGGLVIYEDSAGDVAVAVNGGSAAALLGVSAGDELELS
jgi:S-adenosyl-L-methionine hydrolase (adenosine-forming)